VQADICSRFGVAWHLYGRLTLRELRVLLSVIEEENGGERALTGPHGDSPAAMTRTGSNGERLERIC